MQIVCPHCSARYDAVTALPDVEARQALGEFAKLDDRLALIMRYLDLFRPRERQMSWRRVRLLMAELAALIKVGTVRHGHGAARPTTPQIWMQGIETMLNQRDRLELPLSGHGYLKSVVYAVADKQDAAAERQYIEQTRAVPRRAESAGWQPVAGTLEALYAQSERRAEEILTKRRAEGASGNDGSNV